MARQVSPSSVENCQVPACASRCSMTTPAAASRSGQFSSTMWARVLPPSPVLLSAAWLADVRRCVLLAERGELWAWALALALAVMGVP
ncbi:hypothetical protein D3C71_1585750 [compost metagenome]